MRSVFYILALDSKETGDSRGFIVYPCAVDRKADFLYYPKEYRVFGLLVAAHSYDFHNTGLPLFLILSLILDYTILLYYLSIPLISYYMVRQ